MELGANVIEYFDVYQIVFKMKENDNYLYPFGIAHALKITVPQLITTLLLNYRGQQNEDLGRSFGEFNNTPVLFEDLEDAQAAADWINSQYLMIKLTETKE